MTVFSNLLKELSGSTFDSCTAYCASACSGSESGASK